MKEDMTEKTVPLIWRERAWRFIENEKKLNFFINFFPLCYI